MKKRIGRWVCLAAVLALISGCAVLTEPSHLMKTPNAKDEQRAIYQAVIRSLPSGAKLLAPSKPERTSPIELKDLDGDGEEEAIAFYKTKKDDYAIYILVLRREGDEWKRIIAEQNIGQTLYYADYQDVTGDGTLDIIMGIGSEEAIEPNDLIVYALQGDKLKPLLNRPYTEVAVGNLDEDKAAELVVFLHDREKLTAQAQVYKMKNGSYTVVDTLPMDGTINSYEQVEIGRATREKWGVFVDVGVGAHSAYTDLLIMENGKLRNVFTAGRPEEASEKTWKAYSVPSEDINHDGIMEIATLIEPPGVEDDIAMANMPWITSWSRWDGKAGLMPVHENYNNYEIGFRFDFPSNWTGKVTLQTEEKENSGSVSFYYTGQKDVAEQLPLLATVEYYARGIWKNKEKELAEKGMSYIRLQNAGDYVFIAYLPEQPLRLSDSAKEEYNQMQLSQEEIESLFQTIRF
ncbi:hypothetical protein P9597_08365 [Aneurinibacillus migulanus]|uniref:hypothetical protein n=1 Tax=Aneurinibacillus migulanus TaxID=47500 RepID=UPI002E24135E|nr:hypothetical protein [Aneurinibacillus migulanus]